MDGIDCLIELTALSLQRTVRIELLVSKQKSYVPRGFFFSSLMSSNGAWLVQLSRTVPRAVRQASHYFMTCKKIVKCDIVLRAGCKCNRSDNTTHSPSLPVEAWILLFWCTCVWNELIQVALRWCQIPILVSETDWVFLDEHFARMAAVIGNHLFIDRKVEHTELKELFIQQIIQRCHFCEFVFGIQCCVIANVKKLFNSFESVSWNACFYHFASQRFMIWPITSCMCRQCTAETKSERRCC